MSDLSLDNKALIIAEAIEDIIIDLIDKNNGSAFVDHRTINRDKDNLINAIKGLWQ